MTELARRDEKVTRRVLPRDEAVAHFNAMGEAYKAELIGAIPAGEDVSLYSEGAFEDLCRGPHVPSTGKLRHFKLMKVAGAYWRGDHRNEMLQRIYGTAWATKDELQNYLRMLEEAEKRDHRKLGRRAGPAPASRASSGAGVGGVAPEGLPAVRKLMERLHAAAVHERHRLRVRVHALSSSPTPASSRPDRPPGRLLRATNMYPTMSHGQRHVLCVEADELARCHVPHLPQSRQRSYRELPLGLRTSWAPCHRYEPGRHPARPAAHPRVHAGRQPHLLHRGPDLRRVRGLHDAAAEGLRRLRLPRTSSTRSRRGPSTGSAPTSSGTRPSTP